MNEFSLYLDQVKSRLNIQTDRELSEKLGIHKNHLVYIRKGATFPSDDLCCKIVDLTGDDPAPILALAHKLRATSPKTRKVWERIEKALAASVAACVLVAFFLTFSPAYNDKLKSCMILTGSLRQYILSDVVEIGKALILTLLFTVGLFREFVRQTKNDEN